MLKIIAKAPFVSMQNFSVDFIKTKQVILHSNFLLPLKTHPGVYNTLRVNLERVDYIKKIISKCFNLIFHKYTKLKQNRKLDSAQAFY